MAAFPPLAEIHDDLFVVLQYAGEALAARRATISREAREGAADELRRCAADSERMTNIADFAATLYRLIPKEVQFKDLVGQLAERGYVRHVERA